MDARSFSIGFLAFSLICLSASIVYFTVHLSHIGEDIPDILMSIEETSNTVETVVKEVGPTRELIPPMINEVTEIRKQIPSIVKEVAEVRKQIPTILEEVKEVRQQIPVIIEEVEKIRPLVPLVLDEVKKTREAIPPMLSKADKIVANAKQMGKTTTEGAVTGVITGIIKTPFRITGDLGKSLFGDLRKNAQDVSAEDIELIKAALNKVLSSGRMGHTQKWSNPQSGNDGVVTLKTSAEIDKRDCRIIGFKIRIDNEERIDRDVTFCLNESSEWKPMEQ